MTGLNAIRSDGSNSPSRSANVTKWCTTAGITVLLASISSRLLFATSSFDTPERGAWFGAIAASALLTLLWVILASVLLAIYRSKTGTLFQTVFVMNAIVALLLFAEFCLSR